MKFILGKKIGMTTLYDKEKGALNVTLVECQPNEVSLIRNKEKDGYAAVQVKIAKTEKKDYLKEFRCEEEKESQWKVGDKITVENFEEGERVKVTGITKARGFQGVMKRHGFHGSPATHGHRHDHRAPGSIGSAYPQHVLKGKKMAGRMGAQRFTVLNLEIVYIDKEKNIIGLKGAVPGIEKGIVSLVVK